MGPLQRFSLIHLLLILCGAVSVLADDAVEPAIGATRIARWHDDRTAAFLLMFDDSWPSHFQVAVPELVKRDMTATFYINPGKGEYKAHKNEWEDRVWKAGMAYGNHTMTHKGVADYDDADREIGQCTAAILDTVPGKKPRLMSWAKPGVPEGKWNITQAQLDSLLQKYHLIDRPTFRDHGAVYHLKTPEDMLKLADKAIAGGEMEYIVIHGVERRAPMNTNYQDFWPLDQDILRALLDGLAKRRDRGDLWITDHIRYHQYRTERDAATIQCLSASDQSIRLKLTCTADPQFYDQPLTLITRVPASWNKCRITQGTQQQTVAVNAGQVRFDATPNSEMLQLQAE